MPILLTEKSVSFHSISVLILDRRLVFGVKMRFPIGIIVRPTNFEINLGVPLTEI